MITKIFNNTKRAFSLKSDEELSQSIFIFEMLEKPFMVKWGSSLVNFALKLNLPVEGLIKKTIFKQFCGGTSEENCLPVIEKMSAKNLHSILDYSVEGKDTDEELDNGLSHILRVISFAEGRKSTPFAVFKPTGIGRFSIWEKVTAKKDLDAEEQNEWNRVKNRVHQICQAASDAKVYLLIDAEDYCIQGAADDLVEEMMAEFNKDDVVIFNTIQCYRWDRLEYIKNLHQRAQNKGFKIGVKVVRGAYMEKENARAQKLGYPTPICENKEATDVNYNGVIAYCFRNLDDIHLFIGTHNEVSTYMAMQKIEEMGLEKDDPRIWFSQLYGMSDHISFNLSLSGYNSAKFMPFGPVKDVIPYLIRRAEENSSVKGQTGRELALLREEKQRRKGTFVKRVR